MEHLLMQQSTKTFSRNAMYKSNARKKMRSCHNTWELDSLFLYSFWHASSHWRFTIHLLDRTRRNDK